MLHNTIIITQIHQFRKSLYKACLYKRNKVLIALKRLVGYLKSVGGGKMKTRWLFLILLLLPLVYAQEDEILKTPLTKRLTNMNVSIGVISIQELKSTFPRAYELLVKSHGEPKAYDTHHLAVALWREEKDNVKYLSDYKVEAEVRSPLLRAERKPLTKYPHQYGDNYGGWFQMSDKGLYSINIYIKDDKGKVLRVNFDYFMQ
jgi:hypothetical protein